MFYILFAFHDWRVQRKRPLLLKYRFTLDIRNTCSYEIYVIESVLAIYMGIAYE